MHESSVGLNPLRGIDGLPVMASKQSLTASLLDRLLDYDPGVEKDPPVSPAQATRELHNSVRRDLETLLNTRRRNADTPAGFTELDKSLVNYGIPDFTGANLASADSREEFRRAIESTIRKYEPRFKSVRVILLDNVEPLDRTLRFRIDALVHAEPAPEPVVFDSVLEPVTRSVQVEGASGE